VVEVVEVVIHQEQPKVEVVEVVDDINIMQRSQ